MSSRFTSITMAAMAVAATAILAACGGGGGGGSTAPTTVAPPPPPPPPPPTTWQAGVYPAASTFKDQCQSPRSGVDIEGNTFPDQQGALIDELFWLRSWTEETYLWNDEVTDQDPAGFADRLAYFAQLRTTATTASGEDKDDFHFSQSTEDYLAARNSTPTSGYGFNLVVFSNSVPRDYRIRYTEPNSPASEFVGGVPQFVRGTRILEIDGIDLVSGGATQAEIDILNDGLFPAAAGESHDFVVQDPGAASSRAITVVSADIAPKPVNRMKTISTPTGDVGYILFNTFSPRASEEDIVNAMSAMSAAGVNDLILDLRYNGGGLLAVASQLAYMIAGDTRTGANTSNPKTFELLQFNSNAGNVNPVTGQTNNPIPFYDTGVGFTVANGTPLDSLDLPRVYILSTGRTCSASEAVINGLRGIDVEIILIGDITCGKPYGFYPTDNCGETFYTIQFRGVNEKNFGDYSDGFVPMNSSFAFGERVAGCVVADDFTKELGDETEALLAAALNYRATGSCPAVTSPKLSPVATVVAKGGAEVATTDSPFAQSVFESNRDMSMPEDFADSPE